jgi:hypothetical protein
MNLNKRSIIGKGLSLATLKVSALVVAPLLTAGLVIGASTAAFTGYFGQPGNSWSAGTVALTGDKATAQFAANNIVPGYTESHCITLTSNSSVSTALQFYGSQTADTNQLAENLQLTVVTGSGGTDGSSSCTGFTVDQTVYNGSLAGLGSAHGTPGNAVGITKPMPANGTQQFMITATLPPSTGDAQQGGSAAMDFNWINHS